jgi:PIN domain
MIPSIWLVDYENVQKISPAALPPDVHLRVFVGANQARLPTALVKLQDTLKDRFRFVWIEGTASNALDFHIACHLGEALVQTPNASFVIVSNDKGFDPLIRHLVSRGLRCHRQGQGMTANKAPPKLAEDVATTQVMSHLRKIEKTKRPRKRQTLVNYLTTHFNKTLTAAQIASAIEQLVKQEHIRESGTALAYDF